MAAHTVLLVDDDPDILLVMAEAIERSDFAVMTASNGHEAIHLLDARHFDVLVTDIRMPGMNGLELSVQATAMRPRLRVIYMTGYADTPGTPPRGHVLNKPFRVGELVKIIREEVQATANDGHAA